MSALPWAKRPEKEQKRKQEDFKIKVPDFQMKGMIRKGKDNETSQARKWKYSFLKPYRIKERFIMEATKINQISILGYKVRVFKKFGCKMVETSKGSMKAVFNTTDKEIERTAEFDESDLFNIMKILRN